MCFRFGPFNLRIERNKSTRKASKQAHDALVRVGARVVGVVVNEVPKNGHYGYYGGDGYYNSRHGTGTQKNKTSTSHTKSALLVTRSERPQSSGNSGSLSIAEMQKVLSVKKKVTAVTWMGGICNAKRLNNVRRCSCVKKRKRKSPSSKAFLYLIDEG